MSLQNNAQGIFVGIRAFLSPPTDIEPEVLKMALAVLATISLRAEWIAQEITEYVSSAPLSIGIWNVMVASESVRTGGLGGVQCDLTRHGNHF